MTKHIWSPDLIYTDGHFQPGALLCNDAGEIAIREHEHEVAISRRLNNRAILPGLVNAHSHAFQRVIRGRTEYRTTHHRDSFWTWREMMYSAATRLSPEDVYDASRMAFLEMALSGTTSVGEFHYLHHGPDGVRYEDPNLLAKQVVRAAEDVGLRIALLRVAYARSGYETEVNPMQARFMEADGETFLKNVDQLQSDLTKSRSPIVGEGSHERAEVPSTWIGVAPHSVRAVPLDYLKRVIDFANDQKLPVHMHVAEQPAEVSACIEEYGRSPVALLDTEGLLSERFTAVHSIHVTPKAIAMLARARAFVCACPTTERNLGDGILPADAYFQHGVRIALGTDSHTQIDLLEDARELEYHLRLQKLERVVLQSSNSPVDADQTAAVKTELAAKLFDCATINGAASIGSPGGSPCGLPAESPGGTLAPGCPADFFTVDLDDPSIAGASADDLLSNVVFSLSKNAVKDVVVGGRRIVADGRHEQQEEIVEKFKTLQRKLWS